MSLTLVLASKKGKVKVYLINVGSQTGKTAFYENPSTDISIESMKTHLVNVNSELESLNFWNVRGWDLAG